MYKPKIALLFFGNIKYDARSLNMINSLANKGYQIDVYHASKKIQIHNNIKVFHLKNSYKKGMLKFLKWFILVNKIGLKKYQTIIAGDLYSLIGLNKNQSKNIFYDLRDFFDNLTILKNQPLKKKIWSILEKHCLKYVDTVLTSSKQDSLMCKRKFKKFKHLKYHTIFNFPLFNSFKKNNYLRNKFKIQKKDKILIYQGVVEAGRGIGLMIKQISNLQNAVFVVVGNGKDLDFYKQRVANLELENQVFFHNKVPYHNLFELTSSADVGVALIKPASKNNIYVLPNKLFEYAICQLPVISSNMPSMVNFIKKYNLGLYINVYNKAVFHESIKKLISLDYKPNLNVDELVWSYQKNKFLNLFTPNE